MKEDNPKASVIYSEIVVVLKGVGAPQPTNDIWIAALSAREGAKVLTYDEHFTGIARINTGLLRTPLIEIEPSF